eukprot:3307120-Rhodomonas_salina.1
MLNVNGQVRCNSANICLCTCYAMLDTDIACAAISYVVAMRCPVLTSRMADRMGDQDHALRDQVRVWGQGSRILDLGKGTGCQIRSIGQGLGYPGPAVYSPAFISRPGVLGFRPLSRFLVRFRAMGQGLWYFCLEISRLGSRPRVEGRGSRGLGSRVVANRGSVRQAEDGRQARDLHPQRCGSVPPFMDAILLFMDVILLYMDGVLLFMGANFAVYGRSAVVPCWRCCSAGRCMGLMP